MPTATIELAGRMLGPRHPVFVIAEAGVNHNGDMELARQMVDAAAEAGADAVKFQTFSADRLVTRKAAKAGYQKQTTGTQGTQYTMLQQLELSSSQHRQLLAHAQSRNINFLSTPFDQTSADLLFKLGVAAIKIGSGDLTNLPLLCYISSYGKPIILSTGMAYLGEVEDAVRCIQTQSDAPIILLHCVSNYPASPTDINLASMRTLKHAFGLPVGFSDHTPGSTVSIAAVALGACLIEKHFTLDRSLPGPDQRFSLEPEEFSTMVEAIHETKEALGNGVKRPALSEEAIARVARKSVVSQVEIPAGTVITSDMLSIKRPGTGILPRDLAMVVGRVARTTIASDSVIEWEML